MMSCSLLWCHVVYCDVMLYIVMLCCILWCHVVYCDVMLHSVISCCILWCHVAYCDVMLYIVMACCILWCHVDYCDAMLHIVMSSGLPLLWNQREKWLLFQVLTKEKWEATGRRGESTGRSQNISLIVPLFTFAGHYRGIRML